MIGTGSPEVAGRLDPGRRWIGQLNVRRVTFAALPDAALREIVLQVLGARGFRLAPDADPALTIRIRGLRQEGGDEFDNAHAVRRFADSVLHNHGLRLRQGAQANATARNTILAEDVRDAVSSP